MQNLFRFFTRNGPFFAWLVLAVLSLVLLLQRNPYQRSVWFGSANRVSGEVYAASNMVSSYFGLRTINEDLLHRLGQLEEENLLLRQHLRNQQDIDSVLLTPKPYRYVVAHVVQNSITQAENFLTLDKGTADGIGVGMGVADHNGIVGQVAKTSEHFSLVISVLNPKLRISSCLKNSESIGSLVWDGNSPAYALLSDVPRNVPFELGDTVITTGYSNTFPRGVPVGRICEEMQAEDNNFLCFRVELFTHFDRINNVHVITNTNPCPF
ncbi:MAG: rod shape-determining protein MreC [Bacteroidales bacterium]|nr:rod shape-determining protein MreC [Bacteroidales bacterium]